MLGRADAEAGVCGVPIDEVKPHRFRYKLYIYMLDGAGNKIASGIDKRRVVDGAEILLEHGAVLVDLASTRFLPAFVPSPRDNVPCLPRAHGLLEQSLDCGILLSRRRGVVDGICTERGISLVGHVGINVIRTGCGVGEGGHGITRRAACLESRVLGGSTFGR